MLQAAGHQGRGTATFLFALWLAAQVISFITPPFQSPDEFSHIKRAYLLSQGQWLVTESSGNITGARIDDGLLKYMDAQAETALPPYRALSMSEKEAYRAIRWSSTRSFSGLPNTAVYFPLAYTPQGIALAIGQASGLSIEHSYQLARRANTTAAVALLWLASLAMPLPPLVLALFALPMGLFQLASASPDAVIYSLAVLAAALYLKERDHTTPSSAWARGGLVVSLFTLTTIRANFLPLLLMPLLMLRRHPKRHLLAAAVALIVAVVGWLAFALFTVINNLPRSLNSTQIALYYLYEPLQLLRVIVATTFNAELASLHWQQFIGKLGWSVIPLPSMAYLWLSCLVGAVFVGSLHADAARGRRPGSWSLALMCLLSVMAMQVILIVIWTDHPAKLVEGIYGRYYLPIVLAAAMALTHWPSGGRTRLLAGLAAWLMLLSSVAITTHTLLPKYRWMWAQAAAEGSVPSPRTPGTLDRPGPPGIRLA